MTNYDFGDILLLNAFPYAHLDGVKKRPALVLADTGDQDLILARITTEESRDAYDFKIVQKLLIHHIRGTGFICQTIQ